MVRLKLIYKEQKLNLLHSLNSTMVRLKPDELGGNLGKGDLCLNSTMVRLKHDAEENTVRRAEHLSQFHYGSIKTNMVVYNFEEDYISLNSTMVRLKPRKSNQKFCK